MKLHLSAVVCLPIMGLLLGCGQGETSQNQGRYQGKPDTKPWSNAAPEGSAGTWRSGDPVSWETAIKQRNRAQDEYERIK